MLLKSLWKRAGRPFGNVRRRTSRSRPQARRLRCEPLEERQLLSAIAVFANNTPTAIKDRGTITSAISLPAGYLVSSVTLNITHTRNSDLQAI